MPILTNILDHDLLGPLILQGRREGREEGLQEGREEGLQAGKHTVTRILAKRFGPLPEWVVNRFSGLTPKQLETLAERSLDVSSLEELFPG